MLPPKVPGSAISLPLAHPAGLQSEYEHALRAKAFHPDNNMGTCIRPDSVRGHADRDENCPATLALASLRIPWVDGTRHIGRHCVPVGTPTLVV